MRHGSWAGTWAGEMRTRHAVTRLVIATATVVIALSIPASAQPPKPVVPSRMSAEYSAPPGSLREMSLAADAVVRARVVGSEPEDRQNGERIQTAYRFKISYILHNYGAPLGDERTPLRVVRFGGDRERAGKLVQAYESRFPQFAVGSEFILFLHWNEHERLWEIMWGPAGLIELANGRGRAWSDVGPLSAADGRDTNELIDAIRLLRSGAKEEK